MAIASPLRRYACYACYACYVTLASTVMACAHTSMSSIAAPATARALYSRILVVFDLSDIGLRRDGEDRFQNQHGASTTFVPSYRVFMPGQQYTKQWRV